MPRQKSEKSGHYKKNYLIIKKEMSNKYISYDGILQILTNKLLLASTTVHWPASTLQQRDQPAITSYREKAFHLIFFQQFTCVQPSSPRHCPSTRLHCYSSILYSRLTQHLLWLTTFLGIDQLISSQNRNGTTETVTLQSVLPIIDSRFLALAFLAGSWHSKRSPCFNCISLFSVLLL